MGSQSKCEMCDKEVIPGDDYRIHLELEHTVKSGFAGFQSRLLQNIKRNQETEVEPEVVDIISDDDDDDCTLEERSETVENIDDEDHVEPDDIQLGQSVDPSQKDKIEKSVKNTLDSLFKNVKGMIDGTIPVDNGSEADRNNMTAADLQAEEDALWESFANLKQIISSLEFPMEILENIVKTRNNEPKGEDINRKN